MRLKSAIQDPQAIIIKVPKSVSRFSLDRKELESYHLIEK